MSFEPGDLIDDKYRVVRTIGSGGMGAVYEGVNVRIGRRVAIKVMHGEASKVPDLRRRFAREARVAAKIGSANICDVLDLGDLPDGSSYLVMEFLIGESLEDRLNDRRRLPGHEIAPLVLQLLDGLAAMHGAGVVHRDLKPANIFLALPSLKNTGGGREMVKILDFGISKFQAQLEEADESQTATGALMGTPLYMSPEQSRGLSDLDGRSDLYCVGVILYRALAGEHCFEAANIAQLLFKTATEAPIPLLPRVGEAEVSLVPIIEKAMAKAPADRYQTARELRDALEAWLVTTHPNVALPPAPEHFDGVLSGASGSYPNLAPALANAPAVLSPAAISSSPTTASAGGTGSAWEQKISGGISISITEALPASVAGVAEPSPAPEAAVSALTTGAPASVAVVHTEPPKAAQRGRYVAVAVAVALVLTGATLGLRQAQGVGPTKTAAPTLPTTPAATADLSKIEPAKVELAKAGAADPAPSASAKAPEPAVSAAASTKGARQPASPAKSAPAASVPVAVVPPAEPSAKPGRKIRTEL